MTSLIVSTCVAAGANVSVPLPCAKMPAPNALPLPPGAGLPFHPRPQPRYRPRASHLDGEQTALLDENIAAGAEAAAASSLTTVTAPKSAMAETRATTAKAAIKSIAAATSAEAAGDRASPAKSSDKAVIAENAASGRYTPGARSTATCRRSAMTSGGGSVAAGKCSGNNSGPTTSPD